MTQKKDNVDRMTFRRGSTTFSIFGQLEEVAANILIDAGKATRIDKKDFPDAKLCPDVHYNAQGQPALFAVLIPTQHIEEFEDIIAGLRW